MKLTLIMQAGSSDETNANKEHSDWEDIEEYIKLCPNNMLN